MIEFSYIITCTFLLVLYICMTLEEEGGARTHACSYLGPSLTIIITIILLYKYLINATYSKKVYNYIINLF
jgi:hypothetical protein